MGCVAGTDVAPDPHRRAVVDLNEVEHPIEVEVGERRPSPSIERDDAGRVGGLVKCSVLLSDEKVARVLLRVLDLVGDVALRYEKIDEAVVVHVRELVVPRGRWPRIAAGEWLGRVHPAPEADVAIGRLGRTQGESLQSIVGLAREEDLRITVAGEVVARDAHPLHLDGDPPVVRRIERRRLVRGDAPELLLALGRQVIVLVVAHAEIHSPGAVPIAEEHRERTPARRKRAGRSECRAGGRRSDELVVEAEVVGIAACGVDVPAEGKRRQRRSGLPCRAERRGRGVAAAESPRLVRAHEAAAAEAPQEDVFIIPEHDEVHDPVAIDVDGVSAVYAREVRRRIAEPREAKRPADRAVVAIKPCGVATTC